MATSRTHLPGRGDLGPAAVIAVLAAQGPRSRAQLARTLKVSPATITQVTKSLLSSGVIAELEHIPSGGGRPAQLLGLMHAEAGAVGAKVTADHVTTVHVGLDGAVGDIVQEPFDPDAPDALDVLAHVLGRAVSRSAGLVIGIGIGLPGAVADQSTGVVTAPTLGWTDVPVGTFVARALELPVIVDNDVNTLAVAERLQGAASVYDSPMIVTIGRGIGCGLVVDGALHRGVAGGAGEIGHFPVKEDGPECACGNTGCLEAVIGDAGLVRQARDLGLVDIADRGDLRRAAEAGDGRARQIFHEAGVMLGRVVAGVCHTVAPEAVVVLGEGTDCWSYWANGFESSFRRHLLPSRRSLPYHVEAWTEEKWAVGAASLVLFSPFDIAGVSGEQGRQVRARLSGGILAEAVR